MIRDTREISCPTDPYKLFDYTRRYRTVVQQILTRCMIRHQTVVPQIFTSCMIRDMNQSVITLLSI